MLTVRRGPNKRTELLALLVGAGPQAPRFLMELHSHSERKFCELAGMAGGMRKRYHHRSRRNGTLLASGSLIWAIPD